jgi:predicted metal-dependent hydrolase
MHLPPGNLIKIRKSTRARRMSIAVHRDGSVVAVQPARLGLDRFLILLQERFSWIERTLKKFNGKTPLILLPHSASERARLSRSARQIIQDRLIHFNQFYKFEYKRISIRNQKTRWGSCSSRGNLNFNYRIALLPPELQDYLVVHELCHLKEFNHSKNFWNLVGQQILYYKQLDKALKNLYENSLV